MLFTGVRCGRSSFFFVVVDMRPNMSKTIRYSLVLRVSVRGFVVFSVASRAFHRLFFFFRCVVTLCTAVGLHRLHRF